MDPHIGVAIQALNITQHSVVWIGAAADSVYDRKGDGQQQSL
jgi:hypothetical protein